MFSTSVQWCATVPTGVFEESLVIKENRVCVCKEKKSDVGVVVVVVEGGEMDS